MDDQSASAKTFDAYRIIRPEIARGGMGVVHEALSPEGARVAIKVLNHAKIEGKEREGLREKYANLFKEEYQTLAGLKHPNIARVHKIGFFEGQLYIAQEFIEGKPLAEHVRGWKPIDMIPLFVQALEGLDFIHRSGLVHLDIKSENILVTTSGAGRRAQGSGPKDLDKSSSLRMRDEINGADARRPEETRPSRTSRTSQGAADEGNAADAPFISSRPLTPNAPSPAPEVKIIDFGLAVAPSEYAGSFRGSVSTMAPEVALGKKEDVDARADLFSFGVVMYQCITWGDMPFARSRVMDRDALRRAIERERLPDPPSSVHSGHPEFALEYLDKIVLHLLAKDPKDRFYGNARAVVNALATKSPEVFRVAPDAKTSYLIPESNIHVGREREQEKIFEWADGLLAKPDFQPPVVVIEGGTGLGKSHLMQKIVERLSKNIEAVSLHRIAFPASAVSCANFVAEVEKGLVEGRPTVILLDDVQEAMRASEEYKKIHALIGNILNLAFSKKNKPGLHESVKPVLACMAFNNEIAPFEKVFDFFGMPPDFIERIELKPFSVSELSAYLNSTPALKGRRLPGEWLDRIHSRTGGNPLLIREHLDYIDSDGVLFNLEGDIVINPELKQEAKLPPPGIKARLEGIFEACDADEKRILQLLAVWGWQGITAPAEFNDILELLPLTYLRQKIENLVNREILVTEDDGARYEFKNRDYFPILVYERAPEEERQYWHARIAMHLKNRGVSGEPVDLHAAHGAPGNETYRAILKLGRKLLVQKGDAAIARALFERGMTLAKSSNPKLFACFAANAMDAYLQEGRYGKIDKFYNEATSSLKHAGSGDAWPMILSLKRAGSLMGMGQLDSAEEILKNAPARANSVTRLAILNDLARIDYERAMKDSLSRTPLLARAKIQYEKNKELEKSLPSSARMRVRNNNLGLVLLALGDTKPAIVEIGEKLARHKKEGNIFGVIPALLAICEAYRSVRNYATARDIAMQATELAKRTGQFKWLMRAHNALANIAHDNDRFDEAIAHDDVCLACSALLEGAEERRQTQITTWVHKGHCYKELKQFDKALMNFQSAIEEGADPAYIMSAHEGMGEALFYMGNLSESAKHLDMALRLLDSVPPEIATAYRLPIQEFRAKMGAKSDGDGEHHDKR